MFKNKITKKEFEDKVLEVKEIGNGAHILIPRKFLGLKVNVKFNDNKPFFND